MAAESTHLARRSDLASRTTTLYSCIKILLIQLPNIAHAVYTKVQHTRRSHPLPYTSESVTFSIHHTAVRYPSRALTVNLNSGPC